ncbi:MAG TPA: hypothetical protein VN238_02340 [Solirubrobacteraceae bacterium]|nr:hypothetical protein [Solirubrobacteraceae bacterium]
MADTSLLTLNATRGTHHPDHEILLYRDGDPDRRISQSRVDWRSVKAIQTSKNLNDIAGTFTITLKDRRVRREVREMDAGRIRLRGHYGDGLVTVLKIVVDEVRQAGSADVHASREDSIITGRCIGKYLQVNSLFLPVWDPDSQLPTALTFGVGDKAKKIGGNRPFDVWRYLVRTFVYADDDKAGTAGTPVAKHWLDYQTRFARELDIEVPYLQFNEETVASALKRMEVLGFTESWVDELGRVVYRQPKWDAGASFDLHTQELIDWDFSRGDIEARTYFEVIPGGDLSISTATAQALRAGRAPVPSSYLSAKGGSKLKQSADPEFVIQTDRHGKPTAKGRQNRWYKLQRRLGVRPQQVTSPLIATQKQAQRQAEGLLRFNSRMINSLTATIPGCPQLRLGKTIRVHGELDGLAIDRGYYIEQIAHDYVETEEGGHFHTTFTATHGTDKGDPAWGRIVLPKFDAKTLAKANSGGGVLAPLPIGEAEG